MTATIGSFPSPGRIDRIRRNSISFGTCARHVWVIEQRERDQRKKLCGQVTFPGFETKREETRQNEGYRGPRVADTLIVLNFTLSEAGTQTDFFHGEKQQKLSRL